MAGMPETDPAASVRHSLKGQYHAALAMLRDAVRLCPDSIWESSAHRNACWQVAYHTLFFTHLYSQPTDADFVPWEGHRADVQHPDGIAGPPDPASDLPLLPDPYSKDDVLAYCEFCDARIDEWVDAIDVLSEDSGFSWYPISKLEHQMVNLRHIQHGAAQLADRVRTAADAGVEWAGSRRR
jgi:hypothetical protein